MGSATTGQSDPEGGSNASLRPPAGSASDAYLSADNDLGAYNIGDTFRGSVWMKVASGTAAISIHIRQTDSSKNTTTCTATTTWQKFVVERTMTDAGSGGDFIIGGFSTWVDNEDIYFYDAIVERPGCVAEYDGSGVASDKWFDKSGNDLHGTVSGATVENAPSGEDDGLIYEEGTWTVALYGGSACQLTTSAQSGEYTRIGNLVYASGYILVSSENSCGGSLYISGLPFACASGTSMQGGTIFEAAGLAITAGTMITCEIEQNASHAYVHNWDLASGTSNVGISEFSADGQMSFSMTYKI